MFQSVTGHIAEIRQVFQSVTGHITEIRQVFQSVTGHVAEIHFVFQSITGHIAEIRQVFQSVTRHVAEIRLVFQSDTGLVSTMLHCLLISELSCVPCSRSTTALFGHSVTHAVVLVPPPATRWHPRYLKHKCADQHYLLRPFTRQTRDVEPMLFHFRASVGPTINSIWSTSRVCSASFPASSRTYQCQDESSDCLATGPRMAELILALSCWIISV